MDDYAILGGLSAIHQFCRIGAHAFIGGASAVARDVPPFCMAIGNRAKIVGLNLVGLKRHGFSLATLDILKTAYELLFTSELTLKEAMVQVRQRFPEEPAILKLLQFLETSERGLVAHRCPRKSVLSRERVISPSSSPDPPKSRVLRWWLRLIAGKPTRPWSTWSPLCNGSLSVNYLK